MLNSGRNLGYLIPICWRSIPKHPALVANPLPLLVGVLRPPEFIQGLDAWLRMMFPLMNVEMNKCSHNPDRYDWSRTPRRHRPPLASYNHTI